MLFVIGSDIHGSYKYAELFISKALSLNPKKILLLGDLYYNGARNDPPEEYNPKKVVQLLNSIASQLIVIKGNCESEVDQMVSSFAISDIGTIFAFNKEIVLTHGHHFSFDNLPKDPGDIFIQGHTHIGALEKRDNLILANPGSISLPKDGHHSYMVMDESGIKLLDLLDDHLYKEIKFLKKID